MNFIGKTLFSLLIIMPAWASAAQFTCTINEVLRLDDNGTFVTHGRSALYQNRKFYLDPDTGKVTGTTALHARLRNSDAHSSPVVLRNNGFKAVTLFRDAGSDAVIQINKAKDGQPRPFFYYTRLDMMLTGTCNKG
ncbi:MAG: hypothetical protein P8126_06325 [Gammaproteobacteria bacterium]|jgi:hypothetical protein